MAKIDWHAPLEILQPKDNVTHCAPNGRPDQERHADDWVEVVVEWDHDAPLRHIVSPDEAGNYHVRRADNALFRNGIKWLKVSDWGSWRDCVRNRAQA